MSARKRYPVAPQPERFLEAQANHAAERCCDLGVNYIRIRNDYHGIPRGAVLVEGRVIPDYPHIARVFALAAGVRQSLQGPFLVEEKIDGYNVRIFRVADRCVAITRSGRICPFTTDRLPDLLDITALERLLTAHPDLILCAEVAGPGNPYMDTASPRGGDDIALFVFDLLRQGQEQFVPLGERDALLARYGLPATPRFGCFTADELAQVFEIVRRLDAEGGEGIVL
ncbi:MAG TPA: RNA ligase, partial [Nitrococcus sp.]|nr:RNA ligase [Nitrococcus sp.]